MRSTSIFPVLAALVAGALFSLGAANIGARMIETKSGRAVENKLRLNGYEWATVQSDGLQVVLTGTAPSETAQLAAQRIAGHVVDPARIINVMDIVKIEAISAPPFSIEILRNDVGISLIGLVPASWDRDDFVDDLKKAASTGSIADLLESADYPAPENWDETTKFGLSAIKLLPRAKISLSGTGIAVTGLADSDAQKTKFERTLKRASPDDTNIKINITAPRPVITPFTMRFVIDENGPRFDACSVETTPGQLRIQAAARAAGIASPNCTIGLGAPSTDWVESVEHGMLALSEIGSGTITFSDSDVTLIAAKGTSKSEFDRIIGDLENDLPDVFSLHANLPETEDETQTETPEFLAILSPEGQVQLRGLVTDERNRTASESYARAAFGSHAVYSAMRIDGDLADGWALRSLAAIEALSKLNQGAVTMQETTVSVRGKTGNANARADIARLLSEKLGEGQDYQIDVEYVRKLDPVLNIPTPAECVANANDVISASKIVFEPGKVTLGTEANDTLDRVAAALKECEDTDIEIGAHSDSQGREAMNQTLSSSRANSVLDALLARRVVGVHFSAKGYGETLPIADNDTEDGREANRRIEFKLMNADADIAHDHSSDSEAESATEDQISEPASTVDTQTSQPASQPAQADATSSEADDPEKVTSDE